VAFADTPGYSLTINATGLTSLTEAHLQRGIQHDELAVEQRNPDSLVVTILESYLDVPGNFELRLQNPPPALGSGVRLFRVIRPPSDLTCDNVVDADDVIAGLRQLTGFTDGLLPEDCGSDPIVPNADANRDGDVDLQDIWFIQARIAGLVTDIE
jgi:hypothetical protein